MDLTLAQLRVFVAVADGGSLRAASRRLDMAQSGVTQHLQKLESSVGSALFERGHRGATLTATGERLRIRADVILGECQRTEDEMRQLRGELTGQVSLGVAAEPMMRLFPALLGSFRERCPRIDVHLTSATSRVLTAWVRDGSLDFALALTSENADIHDLDASFLFESPAAVIARRGTFAVPGKVAASLAARRVGQHASASCRRRGEPPADAFQRRGTGTAACRRHDGSRVRHAALRGAGSDYLSLEPVRLAQHPFFREHVTVIPIRERLPSARVCLLRRAGVPLTPAAQELAAMAISFARIAQKPADKDVNSLVFARSDSSVKAPLNT